MTKPAVSGRLPAIGSLLALSALGGYTGAVLWSKATAPEPSLEEAADAMERLLRDRQLGARSRFVETPGGQVHLLSVGEGEGPWNLIVPGLGSSAAEYTGLIRAMARSGPVAAMDLPGTGLSAPVSGGGHPRELWRLVLSAVLDHLGGERVHLIGHSMGGLAAGSFAIAHPNRVSQLVLICPLGVAGSLPPIWNFAMVPGVMSLLAATQRRSAPVLAGVVPNPAADANSQAEPPLAAYQRATGGISRARSDLTFIPRLMRPLGFAAESRLLPGLRLLADRLLVIWGEQDAQLRLEPARRTLAAYPEIELEVVPNAGHVLPFHEPGRVAQLIAEWSERRGLA